jgi:dynactin complex subunit
MSTPVIGGRLRYQESCGTVRYVGQVSGTKAVWIGVEWDDPRRGRHDGSKDGVRYFECTYVQLVVESGCAPTHKNTVCRWLGHLSVYLSR